MGSSVMHAIRAVALHQLRRTTEAERVMTGLRKLCGRAPYASDPRASAFWREAEAGSGK